MLTATARASVLAPTNTEWDGRLQRIAHDIFHTAAYHLVPGLGTAGRAQAFLYEEDDRIFLWPYTLSPTPDASGHYDVGSAYGYPGCVATTDCDFLQRAWLALLDHWKQQNVVSVFSRFHPLLENAQLLEHVRDDRGIPASKGLRDAGSTVSLDLTLPRDEQVRRYQKRLRQTIRKLYQSGVEITEDRDLAHLEDFVRMYNESMARLASHPEYRLDLSWFQRFCTTLRSSVRLFVARVEGRIATADLVLEYGPYVHCHLSGTADEFVSLSPSKALLDFVRVWGTDRGREAMHLGGGLGGRQDSLFEAKRRYSPRTHRFQFGTWVLNANVYRELAAVHRRKLQTQGVDVNQVDFFPFYRYRPRSRDGRAG